MRLRGKFAIVTGGSEGIGLAIAEAFAHEGAAICIIGRSTEKLASASRQLGDALRLSIAADLSTEQGMAAVAEEIRKSGSKIDVLVNNAAVAHVEDFEKVIKDPKFRHMVVWGTTPNRVAIQTSQSASQAADHSFSIESLAESSTAIQAFLDEQFPTTKRLLYRPGQSVPIHGFYYKGAVVFPNTDYYAKLICTAPSFKEIPLPMYFPPEEAVRPGLIGRIRSNIQLRRARRNS